MEQNLRNFNRYRAILLILIGGVALLLPYMRMVYYDPILEFLELTPLQFGTILAIYGTFSTVGTFFSGILADRYSAKWLLVISLILTGIGGLIMMTKPTYYGFMGVYILWALSITFTYNSAYYKALRYCGPEEMQGKLFGWIGSGRQLVNACFAFAAAGSLVCR